MGPPKNMSAGNRCATNQMSVARGHGGGTSDDDPTPQTQRDKVPAAVTADYRRHLRCLHVRRLGAAARAGQCGDCG
jgi:hypothetical protein